MVHCEYGFVRDKNGCEICECKPNPDPCAVSRENSYLDKKHAFDLALPCYSRITHVRMAKFADYVQFTALQPRVHHQCHIVKLVSNSWQYLSQIELLNGNMLTYFWHDFQTSAVITKAPRELEAEFELSVGTYVGKQMEPSSCGYVWSS